MGTDVHMIGEFKDFNGEWIPFRIPDHFTERNYSFFAAIGDVRNGYGFAGVKRHEPITPISSNRGYPDDMSKFSKLWANEDDNVSSLLSFTGDHSFSYVTLKELIEYEWPIVTRTGVIPLDYYKELNGNKPEIWSGGIMGKNIKTIDQAIANDYIPAENEKTYVQIRWKDNLVNPKFINDFIYFLSLYKTWKYNSNEDVRIIFSFDS